jgi:hypothetical protein
MKTAANTKERIQFNSKESLTENRDTTALPLLIYFEKARMPDEIVFPFQQ